MNNEITITVFGANGNLGSHFVNQALEAGFKIKAFVRSASSYEHSNNSKVEVIEGNATNLEDVEKADKRIREEKSVPFVLVRPYALTDKEGKEKYYVTKNQKRTFLKPISRADVAKFMLDAVTDSQWNGSPGVLLGGAKS
jgi:nucleoside-diphosphate-sugar epimerase